MRHETAPHISFAFAYNERGEVVAAQIGANSFAHANDNNGNITKYIDESGNVIAAYEYDDFGRLISSSGPMADFFRHRFSTKYFDAETGLYYYGYRFYSPSLMRWLNRDPIEEDGGLNLYSVMANSPMYSLDAFGLKLIIQMNSTPSRRSLIVSKKMSRPRAITRFFGDCKFSCTKDCKIKVTGHITLWIEMLDGNNSRWRDPLPQYIGNIDMSEEESTYQHELDHYKTMSAFYNFLQTANSYDGCYYSDCKDKVQKLNSRYAVLKKIAIEHIKSFDTSKWNQGGMYELHPLDTSDFKWED